MIFLTPTRWLVFLFWLLFILSNPAYANQNNQPTHGAARFSNHSQNFSHQHTYSQQHNYYHNRYNHNTTYYPGFVGAYVVPYTTEVVTTEDGNDADDNDDNSVDMENSPEMQSWVGDSNGDVPDGAVPNTSELDASGSPTYYCQANYDNQTFYGTLVQNDGCYVNDPSNGATIRLSTYQVLVLSNQ